jgi:hypothetical protein
VQTAPSISAIAESILSSRTYEQKKKSSQNIGICFSTVFISLFALILLSLSIEFTYAVAFTEKTRVIGRLESSSARQKQTVIRREGKEGRKGRCESLAQPDSRPGSHSLRRGRVPLQQVV